MIDKFDPTTSLSEFNDSIRVFRTELFTAGGCGNKVFKLTENLRALKRSGCGSVLSCGGAWSNHLHAFALACNKLGLRAAAVVRGEEQPTNEQLRNAIEHGLVVHYLSREQYRHRYDGPFVQSLCESLQCDAWLPEGGSNEMAVAGCRDIAVQLNSIWNPTHIVVAVGTGATLAGISSGAGSQQQVIGVPVVQDEQIYRRVSEWVSPNCAQWHLLAVAEPAQYGKADQALLQFVVDTHNQTGMVLDPVYNGKVLRAIQHLEWVRDPANRIAYVHTGGIGGSLGFTDQLYDVCDPDRVDSYLQAVRSIININGQN